MIMARNQKTQREWPKGKGRERIDREINDRSQGAPEGANAVQDHTVLGEIDKTEDNLKILNKLTTRRQVEFTEGSR